ncbi:MAG: hypothetical protein COT28_01605 [Methylobacterium sp. CG08_land_8_20_14_0_20_71_15]|nr:MAG: hypothetical protein COT56_07285 [Methylobacterium sp. CG09_land_8_20_14_0_10_71_15]PIU16138.1 MAG: hypothetical protein COT28_01605 [Methylobacterium sp. CG08_land_8_20_14_0_20_71_15]
MTKDPNKAFATRFRTRLRQIRLFADLSDTSALSFVAVPSSAMQIGLTCSPSLVNEIVRREVWVVGGHGASQGIVDAGRA